jgi:hypothetical protein
MMFLEDKSIHYRSPTLKIIEAPLGLSLLIPLHQDTKWLKEKLFILSILILLKIQKFQILVLWYNREAFLHKMSSKITKFLKIKHLPAFKE